MPSTFQRHLTAIESDAVTKTTVIGMRKALNAQARIDRGYSVSRTSPNITAEELSTLEKALEQLEPRVSGDLNASGLKLLQDKRYRRRFTESQLAIINALDHFRLVGFYWHENYHCTPLYRAVGMNGESFRFYNVAWQSGGDGPQILG